jgi:anti-sigma B factor antagonist
MIESKDVNGKKVVFFKGEINAQTGAKLKEEVLKMFDNVPLVVISFKSVIYMNSSGLREIIDLLKKANKSKKELRLCDMSKDIREMFSFTGLDKVFKIFDTETQALR